jgi:hypothetical protein
MSLANALNLLRPTLPFYVALTKYDILHLDTQTFEYRPHHVHLSKDTETARKVGARRGKPVILQVDAGKMNSQGIKFFLSVNGVWLTESVPSVFLARM